MTSRISRRLFLGSTLSAAGFVAVPGALVGAPLSIARKGAPRFLVGLAAYSFREYFEDSSHTRQKQVDPSRQIGLKGFIDYVAEQGCQGAELTSYYFPPEFDREFLLELRRHAFLKGVEISGSAVGNTFTLPDGPELDAEISRVLRWIDHCATLGAPHLRVFAGSPKGISTPDAIKQCVTALKRCADHAGDRGVMLGVENHGGIVAKAEVLEEIIHAVNHDWVRVNLDTGNFYSATPYDDLARLAPYAVNVQLKVEINSQPGGKSEADLKRIVEILRRANYQGYLTLEYEAAEDPWAAIPRHLEAIRGLI
ncbi:MAG TPA: sugar phosphate isomerase/epimerase [Verrucomicrobiales bacterium]|nr:sugar phosphate isomerase/epimerase [Verrucomicrobiales bacterium]